MNNSLLGELGLSLRPICSHALSLRPLLRRGPASLSASLSKCWRGSRLSRRTYRGPPRTLPRTLERFDRAS